MVDIRPLAELAITDLQRIASGYVSDSKYSVVYTNTEGRISFDLRRVLLDAPYTKKYDPWDDETLARYTQILEDGYSFGAYDGAFLIGLIIAEPHRWDHSLWVWEFHVAEAHRNRGIGKRLMSAVVAKAKEAGCRIIVCETQNTNVPAIEIYHRLGFRLEGVDISYYTNDDYPEGEVAVFMKRRLT